MKIVKYMISLAVLIGVTNLYATIKDINGVRYEYSYYDSTKTASIYCIGKPYSGSPAAFDTLEIESLVVPEYIGDYKVVKVGLSSGTVLTDPCRGIKKIVLPATLLKLGTNFISEDIKLSLETIEFLGDAPDMYINNVSLNDMFKGCSKRLEIRVPHGSIGWDGGVSAELPDTWYGRKILFSDENYEWDTGIIRAETTVNIVSTNVVIHVVQNSIEPTFALPASNDMGFVNIITEVKNNGIASIPISWAMSYPNYTSTFGTDFTASLMKPTGKKDATGKDMLVWQDYVAGTDPTDVNDVLKASITIVDGNPVISYTPELDAERKAMRKYTIYGKAQLTDEEWTELEPDAISGYNFFKVTVEMK